MKRKLHHWTKEDFILTLYVAKYGNDGIGLKDDKSLSEFIGTTTTSFKKMVSNFKHLLGIPNQLDHIKSLQQIVFDEYSDKSFMEHLTDVRVILNNDDKVRRFELGRKGVKNYHFIGSREVQCK